jgi:ribosomal protein S27AE
MSLYGSTEDTPVMTRLLSDPRFYEILVEIDQRECERFHGVTCPRCGKGTLHAAHFPRKPRGCPIELPRGFDQRYSFCCSRCRHRATPPSVRYLGRRWHLAPLLLVLPALMHGVTSRRVAAVKDALGDDVRVSMRTLRRWRRWWLMLFPRTPTWRAGRGRFTGHVDEQRLPQDILGRFLGDAQGRLIAALRFLRPLTTNSGAQLMEGPPRR